MKSRTDLDRFKEVYLSVVQILVKLADPTFLWGEIGRGSGKTTHMLSPRVDRVQNAMPGSLLVLGASTYKSIFDNIIPGIMEYMTENYSRGLYFEIGNKPPRHFAKPHTFIEDWKHTISFASGTVIQFVSCDRPESMLGKSAAHLFVDEMIRIPEDKFIERIIPALRADRSKYGHSEYFMGITGFSSSPNFETDEDWFTKFEENMNCDLIKCIQEIAYEIDQRILALEDARAAFDDVMIRKLTAFLDRWSKRLTAYRRNQTLYLRASSFSNLKILGIDYIENQIKSLKDEDKLYTSIFSIRKAKVKERFFGKFSKLHIFHDSYNYGIIDTVSADGALEQTARHLKYYDPNLPLYAGYDPGPFMSIVFAQRKMNRAIRELRTLKNFWVIHPHQHAEMAKKINDYFKYHRNKTIYLYFDRAANQKNPRYRKYYQSDSAVPNETDANILKAELQRYGWNVQLLSIGQATIFMHIHYALLNILFGKNDGTRDQILVDANECEELISSINNSPLKRHEGKIELDKSSERLPYERQAMESTQIATAFMYLLHGLYKNLLPRGMY